MRFKYIIHFRGIEIPTITLIVFLVAFIWGIGMIIAPLTLPANSVEDLSGGVMSIENEDITEDMNPYARFYYQAGDGNCHTLKERSHYLNGNQIPFCARDVGIFLGMALGSFIVLFKRFDIKIWWIIGGLVPMGIDWLLNSYLHVYHSNITRLLTGGLTGLVVTLALGFVIHDLSKMAEVSRQMKESPPQTPETLPYPETAANPQVLPEGEQGHQDHGDAVDPQPIEPEPSPSENIAESPKVEDAG